MSDYLMKNMKDRIAFLGKMQKNEVNWSIGCFYDAGFTARLGDELNGFTWEFTNEVLEVVINRLIEKIMRLID